MCAACSWCFESKSKLNLGAATTSGVRIPGELSVAKVSVGDRISISGCIDDRDEAAAGPDTTAVDDIGRHEDGDAVQRDEG